MDDLTKFLAIWGAIISTIALTWNILRFSKEKGRIKIIIQKTFISRDDLENEDPKLAKALLSQYNSDESLIPRTFINLFNVGKKPITIVDIKLILENEFEDVEEFDYKYTTKVQSVSFTQECPITLSEGGFHRFHLTDGIINQNFNGIEVLTSDGRIFKLTKKVIKLLKENAEFNSLPAEIKLEYFLGRVRSKNRCGIFNFFKKNTN